MVERMLPQTLLLGAIQVASGTKQRESGKSVNATRLIRNNFVLAVRCQGDRNQHHKMQLHLQPSPKPRPHLLAGTGTDTIGQRGAVFEAPANAADGANRGPSSCDDQKSKECSARGAFTPRRRARGLAASIIGSVRVSNSWSRPSSLPDSRCDVGKKKKRRAPEYERGVDQNDGQIQINREALCTCQVLISTLKVRNAKIQGTIAPRWPCHFGTKATAA